MKPQTERFMNPELPDELAATIRPKRLADFIGMDALKQNLGVFISGARARGEAMDHVLLFGPPGLGKTTLAHIIAGELGTNFRATAAPMLTKQGDLAAILTALEPMDVLFIDEIHRLPTAIEEVLYSAMEDFKLDIMIGEGPSAKSVRIDLPPFTLVGATTRTGLISNPLRDRFGIDFRLQFYPSEDLAKIISRSASILGIAIEPDAAVALADSSRGTPRIANRLLKRARDFAVSPSLRGSGRKAAEGEPPPVAVGDSPPQGGGHITADTIKTTLFQLQIDERGLDGIDRDYMNAIAKHYAGGPVGIENLSAVLAEPSDTIEDVIEPYLMQQGFIQRTPRGRILTEAGYEHIGLSK
ncbi:MAG: Holliday junction branch migration DNA helicase RuvB [Alphaproteobacteria bacterium]|nr:Holliday junction branch migration DNA helicase RuvB [Alphaproteobacteria bacterium]MCL2889701.1 Holliday junction branch migration DNA helicase RuvB [Alphaproteobacteria bacterium]